MNAGTLLKQERKNKGLSLQEVEEVTKIRVKYLVAIENNSIENLMELAYALCFIRSYARFLNIKQDALAELLPKKTFTEDALVIKESTADSRSWWIRLINKVYGNPQIITR